MIIYPLIFIYLFIYLVIYLFIYSFICPAFCLFIHSPNYYLFDLLSIYLFIHLLMYVYTNVCMYVRMYLCMYLCIYVCMHVSICFSFIHSVTFIPFIGHFASIPSHPSLSFYTILLPRPALTHFHFRSFHSHPMPLHPVL